MPDNALSKVLAILDNAAAQQALELFEPEPTERGDFPWDITRHEIKERNRKRRKHRAEGRR